MKKLIYSALSIVLLAITFSSCVNDTDYETPQLTCKEPILTGSAEKLSDIITAWQNSGETVKVFREDYTDYIVGYVLSNDKTGNFYKELYIQDSPTDPTATIKLNIDMRSLFTKYKVGSKIYIYLHGLSISLSHGEIVINEANGKFLRENVAKANILRSCDETELTPVAVATPSLIDESYLGKYVELTNVQFDQSLLEEDFVDNNDSYDTHRNITSCDDSSQIKLETSTFASFGGASLPQGQGSVKGIITYDYGADFFVLRVNSPEDFNFEGERCDPDYLFYENFETQIENNTVSGNGWTNYREAGTKNWEAFSDDNSLGMSAKIGSYQSGDTSTIAWLISPAINLDEHEGETFSFKTSNSYADASDLEVLSSTDWDGTTAGITTATWTTVPDIYIVQNGDYYKEWFDSGEYDLSTITGNIYFAFKYTGSGGSGFDGTYELDEVKVAYTE
ncbi:MAG TPA: hypothetical protein EYG92_12175 [Lutibacter sp.]|nr:hypothetical protein [Lutibacter sp.]